MSRSYKKTPVCKGGRWITKRLANKIIRRQKLSEEELPTRKRSAYKKGRVNSWDIVDYTFRWTLNDAIKHNKELANFSSRYSLDTEEEVVNNWQKWYYRK